MIKLVDKQGVVLVTVEKGSSVTLAIAAAIKTGQKVTGLTVVNQILDKTDWVGVDFSDCTFMGCDLSNVYCESVSFTNADFIDCKMPLKTVATKFDKARLTNCSFEKGQYKVGNFVNAEIVDCVFKAVNFDLCSFAGATINIATLSYCFICEGDFHAATLSNIFLVNTSIFDSTFGDCEGSEIILGHCECEGNFSMNEDFLSSIKKP